MFSPDRLVVHADHRRLVVERVDMAGAAVHVKEDDALGLGGKMRLLRGQRIGELRRAVGGAGLTAKNSSPSSAASATPPKPPPACQRNSRRVRPQKLDVICLGAFRDCRASVSSISSFQVHKLVQVQGQQAELPQRFSGRSRFGLVVSAPGIAGRGQSRPWSACAAERAAGRT